MNASISKKRICECGSTEFKDHQSRGTLWNSICLGCGEMTAYFR